MGTKSITRMSLLATLTLLLALGWNAIAFGQTAPSTDPGDRATFCDFRNQPSSGDVATWWKNSAPEGGVDCFDLSIQVGCGRLDASFLSYIVLQSGAQTDYLYWVLGSEDSWSARNKTFPILFEEDANGGSVQVVVGFSSPENQTIYGMDPVDEAHWSGTGGEVYTIITDCQQDPEPEVVVGCSQGYYKNHDAEGLYLTLSEAGIESNYPGAPSLLEVISNPGNGKVQKGVQTYDGYIRQQVTAYLNVLNVPGFPLSADEVLAGPDMGTLEYYNHGGADVICPLGS